jgi:hypothetical protein
MIYVLGKFQWLYYQMWILELSINTIQYNIFSKIFEKAMYSRLNQHLYTNNILVPERYAFRKGMSTEDAAFRLTDSVLKSLNHKLHVGGIF